MKKRVFAALLALCLTLSFLPVSTLAYVGTIWDTFTVSKAYEDGYEHAMTCLIVFL